MHLTWGLTLDHLGRDELCRQRWADVERHHELAVADPANLPDTMLAMSHAERALLAARLGDAGTARRHLRSALAARAEPRSPTLRRILAHAEGATLAAEHRYPEARDVLVGLWESVRHRQVPARTEDVPLLLARVDEADGRPADALRWYREVYARYGQTQQEAWLARETTARLRVEQEALLRRSRELEADALTDPLTGLPNRRAFDVELPALVTAAQAVDSPLTLAVLDVDRFKRINDEHGHPDRRRGAAHGRADRAGAVPGGRPVRPVRRRRVRAVPARSGGRRRRGGGPDRDGDRRAPLVRAGARTAGVGQRRRRRARAGGHRDHAVLHRRPGAARGEAGPPARHGRVGHSA